MLNYVGDSSRNRIIILRFSWQLSNNFTKDLISNHSIRSMKQTIVGKFNNFMKILSKVFLLCIWRSARLCSIYSFIMNLKKYIWLLQTKICFCNIGQFILQVFDLSDASKYLRRRKSHFYIYPINSMKCWFNSGNIKVTHFLKIIY